LRPREPGRAPALDEEQAPLRYESSPADVPSIICEPRWPMAVTVVVVIVLTFLLPNSIVLRPRWIVPVVEGILLVALIIRDPGRIDRVRRSVRALSIILVAVLVGTTLGVTAELISALVQGGPAVNSADSLLAAGGLVWISNCLAFGLLYWELDGGGAAVRAHRLRAHPDFAFVQQINPELAPKDWRPRLIDYLYLGFTAATAFSPTDTMPPRPALRLLLLHDDPVREFDYVTGAEKSLELAKQYGWTVVSMKNDWKTVFA
jgi:hypothetical protein